MKTYAFLWVAQRGGIYPAAMITRELAEEHPTRVSRIIEMELKPDDELLKKVIADPRLVLLL